MEDWLRLHGVATVLCLTDSPTNVATGRESGVSFGTATNSPGLGDLARIIAADSFRPHCLPPQCGECGFTTSASSAQFAERSVCPYCDERLVRRGDDDLIALLYDGRRIAVAMVNL
jgi:predicted Zn-ribbon and HTH transcriptional regulator